MRLDKYISYYTAENSLETKAAQANKVFFTFTITKIFRFSKLTSRTSYISLLRLHKNLQVDFSLLFIMINK